MPKFRAWDARVKRTIISPIDRANDIGRHVTYSFDGGNVPVRALDNSTTAKINPYGKGRFGADGTRERISYSDVTSQKLFYLQEFTTICTFTLADTGRAYIWNAGVRVNFAVGLEGLAGTNLGIAWFATPSGFQIHTFGVVTTIGDVKKPFTIAFTKVSGGIAVGYLYQDGVELSRIENTVNENVGYNTTRASSLVGISFSAFNNEQDVILHDFVQLGGVVLSDGQIASYIKDPAQIYKSAKVIPFVSGAAAAAGLLLTNRSIANYGGIRQ